MSEAILARLLEMRNDDGGWGTSLERPSSTEATALGIMAATAMGADDAVTAAAADWLSRQQRPDGSWSIMAGVEEPSWASSLAVLALIDRPGQEHAIARGLDWLTGQRGVSVDWRTRIIEFFRSTRTISMDPTLNGWPWAEGNFSWVEPTAYGIIALSRWPGGVPRRGRGRIDEGRELILDRTCAGGGWNFGSSETLGVQLEPYPDSTAIALLALAGSTDGIDIVMESLAALDGMISATRSGLTLALAALAMRAWDRDDTEIRRMLEQTYEETGFLDDVRSHALALLALSDGEHPLEARP